MVGREVGESDSAGQPRREERLGGLREERRVAAWIGASLVIEGNLTSSENMTIAGRVEGDVAVPEHELVIAPQARIRGDIVARTVLVHGEVRGTITATGKAEVGETGSVHGDVIAPRLVVAEGAVLQGRVGAAARAQRPG